MVFSMRCHKVKRLLTLRRIVRSCFSATMALLVLVGTAWAQSTEIPFHSASKVRFATVDEAAALLGTADPWIQALSPFDRSAHSRQPVDPGQDAYLKFMAAEAQAWTAEQMDTLRGVIESADRRIERLGLELSLPPTVLLIRTTGNEQSDAGYTRENAIILPDRLLSISNDQLEQLFLHELFHVMSRHEPGIRERLYGIIGYRPCPGVRFPEELLPLRMTNPDAFHHDFCIDVYADGVPQTVTPIIYARGPYTEGGFFEWVEFRLMAVERNQRQWRPARDEGDLVLFEVGEVDGFFEKIGTNTNYIIHPEETMADNFVFAVVERDDLSNPEIARRVRNALKESR